jgi:release factor glutamine methyltransferase
LEGLSLTQAKEMCRRALMEAGTTDTPELEARLLLEKATSLGQVDLILRSNSLLNQAQAALLQGYLDARLGNEPMAYILGEKEFYGRTFKVDRRVLIPRPDTETLVETALGFARNLKKTPKIIDVCTGSGCVGITLAAELHIAVTLSDISDDALAVAKANALSLLDYPLPLLKGNLLCPTNEKYDIIVSNPPYLTALWCDEVSQDVKKEPRLALEGFGNDGLDCIRDLIRQSTAHLETGGALMLECDYRQNAKAAELLRDSGFTNIHSVKDLSGRERVIWGIL